MFRAATPVRLALPGSGVRATGRQLRGETLDALVELEAPVRQLLFLTLELLDQRRALFAAAAGAKEVDPSVQLSPAGGDSALFLLQVREGIRSFLGLGAHGANIGRTTPFRETPRALRLVSNLEQRVAGGRR